MPSLNGAQRDSCADDGKLLSEIAKAGTHTTAKIDDASRLGYWRQTANELNDLILDVVKCAGTIADTGPPHRAMYGSYSSALTERDKARRVAIVVASDLRRVESRRHLMRVASGFSRKFVRQSATISQIIHST